MSQETRGSDDARKLKIIAAILMCVGMFMSFIWIGFVILLVVGFFLFVVGRFME
jgi:fatty acid desaturase